MNEEVLKMLVGIVSACFWPAAILASIWVIKREMDKHNDE